jgi:hypothetical protein
MDSSARAGEAVQWRLRRRCRPRDIGTVASDLNAPRDRGREQTPQNETHLA